MFDNFDKDKSGTIDVSEVQTLLKALNVTTDEEIVKLLFKSMDKDGMY